MIRCYKTQAIILGRRNSGEADKLLTVFSREFGKKQLLAKGIRRVASRRAPYLEPFSYVIMQVYKGRSIDIVTEVESIQTFELLRKRLERIGFGFIALELTERLTAEHQESEIVFTALLAFIAELSQENTTRSKAQEMLVNYKKFLLEHLGFLGQRASHTESFLDEKIESVLESPLRSLRVLTNIQSAL